MTYLLSTFLRTVVLFSGAQEASSRFLPVLFGSGQGIIDIYLAFLNLLRTFGMKNIMELPSSCTGSATGPLVTSQHLKIAFAGSLMGILKTAS